MLKLTKRKKSKYELFTEQKSPASKRRHVGVEIEFYCDDNANSLIDKFSEAKLDKYVTVKTDGSINPACGMYGHEINVLCLETNYRNVLKRVCKVMVDAGGEVNRSCGLHIHLDMRHRDPKVIFNNLVVSQPILYYMNPSSRAVSDYCIRTSSRELDDAHYEGRTGINACAYVRHETIEIRIHSGTINSRKISRWVELLLTISKKKLPVNNDQTTMGEFVKTFRVSKRLASYVNNRIKNFNPDSNVA